MYSKYKYKNWDLQIFGKVLYIFFLLTYKNILTPIQKYTNGCTKIYQYSYKNIPLTIHNILKNYT